MLLVFSFAQLLKSTLTFNLSPAEKYKYMFYRKNVTLQGSGTTSQNIQKLTFKVDEKIHNAIKKSGDTLDKYDTANSVLF